MMAITPETTLAELVTGNPRLAGELERRGLDYCCGGARTLAQACAGHGLDAAAVAAELAGLSHDAPSPDWAAMAPGELAAHIVATHHHYLWSELPRLSGLVDKVMEVHGSRHRELVEVQRCFRDLRSDLEPHMLKEERVLFPLIDELEAGRETPMPVGSPIAVMRAEHDHAGDLLAELRRLTDGYRTPSDGCGSYRACYEGLAALEADTHLHVHKENNVLFPAVLRRASPAAAR